MELSSYLPDRIAALCVWREARNQSYQAKLGVAWTIKNRMRDARGRWPKDAAGVVLQRWQFSSFNANDPNATKYPDGEPCWAECERAAACSDPDPTGGAVLYHSFSDAQRELWPHWAHVYPEAAHLGAFRFYRQP